MRSLQDQNLGRTLNMTTFGTFSGDYMGVSISNLEALEEEIFTKIEALQEQASDPSPGAFENAREQLTRLQAEPRYRLYWRVRSHEKAHFYQHVSMTATLSRVFSAGDTSLHLLQALREFPPDLPIRLPLGLWAAEAQLGDEDGLAFVLRLFQARLLIDLAIDGFTYKEHFIQPGKHLLQNFYPDLEPGFWDTPEFALGVRALLEGSAKASEWLYLLRAGSANERDALDDIYGSPDEYFAAFDYLVSHIPGKSTFEYLQALAVLVDFAMHSKAPWSAWPFVWLNPDGQPAGDVLPCFRFARLVDLLASAESECDFTRKESLFAYLADRVTRDFGWPSPEECTARLVALMEESVQNLASDIAAYPEGLVHPVARMKNALDARMKDQSAFIAPINAPLLTEHDAVPSGFIGSHRYPPSASDNVLMMFNWYTYTMVTMVILEAYPHCPLLRNSMFEQAYRSGEGCRQLLQGACTIEHAREAGPWNHLCDCDLFGRFMEQFFGSNWRTRVTYRQF